MNLSDLNTFLEVVRTGSFTKAAAVLHVPKSTVSRRVSRLEAALGLELLVRKARTFTVSDYGRQLETRCAPALREIAEVERTLEEAHGEPSGVLRVTATSDLGGSKFFAGMLAEFQRAWPSVAIDLELTSRRVDLVEEGFDLGFRAHAGPLPDSASLTARRLVTNKSTLAAAPRYLEEHGIPRTPKDLAKHSCLSLRIPAMTETWALGKRGTDQVERFRVDSRVTANDFAVLIEMAIAGAGIAQLPSFLALRHVACGELAPVLPRWTGATGCFSLIWPVTRYPSPRVRRFIDHAVAAFAAAQ